MTTELGGAGALKDLQLTLQTKSGNYCAARAGVGLVMYYPAPMSRLAIAIGTMFERYTEFIPPDVMKSLLSTTGVWRDFTKDGFARRLRRLAAEGIDYSSIHVSSGTPANVGEYGFHFFGSNLRKKDLKPRETCSCVLEFPLEELQGVDNKRRFVEFATKIAEIEPFESGYGGYAFKHLARTWRDQALPWIGQHAVRFIGVDISHDSLREEARGLVVNVSWITLLGESLVVRLGGEAAVTAKLSADIPLVPVKGGWMLIAGKEPAVGDVNRGAADLEPLREVARLTKPIRVRMDLGFGSEEFRHGWLDRLDKRL